MILKYLETIFYKFIKDLVFMGSIINRVDDKNKAYRIKYPISQILSLILLFFVKNNIQKDTLVLY